MTDTLERDTLRSFLRGLPKAELHVHLDGTMEPELKLLLARRNGVAIAESTAEEIRAKNVFHDLPSFLAVHYANMTVLWTEDDYRDLAHAYLLKAASQGVRHAEMFFDPQLHTSRGVPFSTIVRGYRRAILDARAETGISAELIMCFLRDRGPDFAMATLMESLPYKDWIIGVGLDSDEKDNPPALYAEVFARARAEGFLLTMHCDIDQEDSLEHIRQAVQDIQVDRIDHGTNVVEDPALVDEIRARGIGLTCCPLSNGFVAQDMKAPAMLKLMDEGVRVTINSDDPPYFGGYVLENWVAFAEFTGLGRPGLVQLARNSFEASWLSGTTRERYLAELESYSEAAGPA